MGANHVQISRRTDFVGQSREDSSTAGVLYIGITPDFDTSETDALWQIQRVYYTTDGVKFSEFANGSKFNCKWVDRATIFDTPLPGNLAPFPTESVTAQTEPVALSGPVLNTQRDLVPNEWRPVIVTPLTNRRALNIQNNAGQDIWVNGSNSAPLQSGMRIGDGGERNYDALPSLILYACTASSPGQADIEEVAHT